MAEEDLVKRLKSGVHYTVGQMCQEVGEEKEVTFSKQAIAAISEITSRQCETFAKDLELFARHAKRSTITMDDVKLLSRRSPSLQELDGEKKNLVNILSGIFDWMPLEGDDGDMRNSQDPDLPYRPERSMYNTQAPRDRGLCKNFFWKTFSAC